MFGLQFRSIFGRIYFGRCLTASSDTWHISVHSGNMDRSVGARGCMFDVDRECAEVLAEGQ